MIALDDPAATLVRRIAREPWHAARFYTLPAVPGPPPPTGEIRLRRTDGIDCLLSAELIEADVAVMVATTAGRASAADAIGRACARRGIMAAGLVLGPQEETWDTLLALRPHAQVLLVSGVEQDVSVLLTALRA